MLVIISSKQDAHIPFVTAHLTDGFVVIDPEDMLTGAELTYALEDGEARIIYSGKVLHNIHGVWFRKPARIEDDKIKVDPRYQHYAGSALRRHFCALMACFPNAFWISDYWAIERANCKPLQAKVASEVGFRVPASIYTNSSASAKQFVSEGHHVVVKPLASIFPEIGDGVFFPTTKIPDSSRIDLAGLYNAPAIFQRYIDPKVEVRVTVVGEKVFGAAIYDRPMPDYPNVRDWRVRYNPGKAAFQEYTLSSSIEKKCVELVHRLGLQYGAIDLIVDSKNSSWFLEANPNGQWAFIEEDTGLPIGKSIAALLETRKA